jgi:peptide methionine sulfoxide reductase msrA/msrB
MLRVANAICLFALFACVPIVIAALGDGATTGDDASMTNDKTAADTAAATRAEGDLVPLRVFTAEGELVGPFELPRLELTDEQWRERLTDEQFRILRKAGTEAPFCGTLLDNKIEGVYSCAGCGLPLFSSDHKFTSGTGWPSYYKPIAKENITEKRDMSLGMVRTEICCARCDGHLGHVFEDGPRPTGLRYCLNSESMTFTSADEVAELGELKTAVVAGGCFWCVEAVFEQLKGVVDVESGYTGGTDEDPTYREVVSGGTGHAEAVRITYDPDRITYAELLDVHFSTHDPTTLNRQGADIGTQYRSAIFFASEQEKADAEAFIAVLNEEGVFSRPIVTTLEPLETFHVAEAYHQDYVCNNPNAGYVRGVALPKVKKVREKFAEKVRENTEAAEQLAR